MKIQAKVGDWDVIEQMWLMKTKFKNIWREIFKIKYFKIN